MKLKQLLGDTTIDTQVKIRKESEDRLNPIVFETDKHRIDYDYFVFDECIEEFGYCKISQISVEEDVLQILIK